MDGWVDGWLSGWRGVVDGWVGGLMVGWMGGWMDGWIDGRVGAAECGPKLIRLRSGKSVHTCGFYVSAVTSMAPLATTSCSTKPVCSMHIEAEFKDFYW